MSTIYDGSPLPILEARLDWVTATIKSPAIREIVRGRAGYWMTKRKEQGYVQKSFKTPFYEGQQVDGLAVGIRRDDMLVNLSGKLAAVYGPQVITWADNISRLDVQVTLQDGDLTHRWAEYVNDLAKLHTEVKSEATHTRFITSTPHGSTCYIGSPGSSRMLRCYDKWAESDGEYPPGSWRWEVQWRHHRAKTNAQQFISHGASPTTALNAVCDAYHHFGIAVPAVCIPTGWKDRNIKGKTDQQRQLDWLKTSIAPCVGRLIDAVGFRPVLTALDLESILDTIDSQARMIEFGVTGYASGQQHVYRDPNGIGHEHNKEARAWPPVVDVHEAWVEGQERKEEQT